MQYEDDFDPDYGMIEVDSSVETRLVNAFTLSLEELEQIARDFENPFSGDNDKYRREGNRDLVLCHEDVLLQELDFLFL